MIPHGFLEVSYFNKFGRWQNVSPRGNIERAATKLGAEHAAMLKRAQGAHSNGLEAFPLYAAGVIAANWAGVPTATLNKLSIWFSLLRFVYNPIYIYGSNEKFAALRSLVWFASQGISLYLLKLSGDAALAR